MCALKTRRALTACNQQQTSKSHACARAQADGTGVIYITPTFPWRVLAEEPLPGYGE